MCISLGADLHRLPSKSTQSLILVTFLVIMTKYSIETKKEGFGSGFQIVHPCKWASWIWAEGHHSRHVTELYFSSWWTGSRKKGNMWREQEKALKDMTSVTYHRQLELPSHLLPIIPFNELTELNQSPREPHAISVSADVFMDLSRRRPQSPGVS